MKATAPIYLLITALLLAARIATAESTTLREVAAQADSVDEAVQIVSDRLGQQGFEIPLVVNHAAAAASVELELRPTQVIFARPPKFLEQSLLRRGATIGIDLPLKYLVFEDENGDVQLRSNPVGYLIDRHDLRIRDFGLYLTGALASQFADSADGLITVLSQRSFDDTVQALQDAIGGNPAFRIPLVLDFGESRRRNGPVLIVFGNPNAGTPLMQGTQEIALDLPQKFLVSQSKGVVSITYNDPLFVAKRANLEGQDARLTAIANALANFAAAGAATNSAQ
ncbi:MAG: DUF302 domain-containing protein [Pseudomonadales bacterium]